MASDWSISCMMLWCLQKLSWGGITLHLSVTQNWHSYMYPLTSILLSLRKQIWPWTYRRLNWQRVSHITTYPLQTPTVFGGVRVVLCSCLCCVAFFFCFFLSSSCVLCTQCCQCLWIVYSWLHLRFYFIVVQCWTHFVYILDLKTERRKLGNGGLP
jgi:hypothetical protein